MPEGPEKNAKLNAVCIFYIYIYIQNNLLYLVYDLILYITFIVSIRYSLCSTLFIILIATS